MNEKRFPHKYCVHDFKSIAQYGAASTHGGTHCKDCRNRSADGRACRHPDLLTPFSLGPNPERMGCFYCFEPAEGGDK